LGAGGLASRCTEIRRCRPHGVTPG
jgi:hypothetical protein